ncbi:MAG: alpha/beta hydrolase [Lachnospiraceae bacterium]|nr:alpha/beta hydrolase [Lachnospiraceae bacterium]
MIITVEDKEITLFRSEQRAAPLVILNTFENEGEKVWEQLKSITSTPVSLAAIGKINWNDEMSPWQIDPVTKWDEPFTGGADAYLEKLTTILLPEIIKLLPDKPAYIALAGYSLAGLFAIYSLYHTDQFDRIASASGSLWYPGFIDYVRIHEMKRAPEGLYLSLGDREAKTRNPVLQTVQEHTQEFHQLCLERGIQTTFELTPGNHFHDSDERMAKGIAWMIDLGEK